MTSSHLIESLRVCHHSSAHTLSGAVLQKNKMVIKYCHDAIGSASSYLRTNGPFSNQLILSPNRLSFPPISRGHGCSADTRATFSGTCQLQTITTINGLPLLGPLVAAGRSRGGEGKLQRVQQQRFAFQGPYFQEEERDEEWIYAVWLEGVDLRIWTWWSSQRHSQNWGLSLVLFVHGCV